MRNRGGFSLAEVVVALVVFEVGFLGVVSMTLQAQRTFLAAAALESGSRVVEWLADSLSHAGWGGPGSIETQAGSVRWTRGPGGLVTVAFEGGPGANGSVSVSTAQPDVPAR